MNEVYEFLKNAGTYYLATIEDGKPRVRPFGTVDLFEGGLYIQTGKIKNVSKQIHANPDIEICAFKDGEWIRLACKAFADESREAKKHMLDNYPTLRSMYSEDDDNTEVFRLKECRAVISSFTKEPKVIEF